MKSILIVTEQFTLGGLETHIQGEIKKLSDQGVSVHMAVGNAFDAKFLPPSLSSVTSGIALEPRASAENLLAAIDQLRAIIRQHSIDAVHVHPFTSIIPAAAAAELEGIPYAITLHGPDSLSSYGPIYDFLLKEVILSSAPLIFSVSPEVSRLLSAYSDPNAVFYVPNSVDFEETERSIIGGERVNSHWLLVSRFDKFKVPGILDFCVKAKKSGITKVLIAGDGPEKSNLVQSLENSGLSNFVNLAGACSDISELMLQSSGVAGMGRVVLEAVAAKRPVVLVGYDGVKGVIDAPFLENISEANFSGRGLPVIDAENLSEQLRVKINSETLSENYRFAKSKFNEINSWCFFKEKIFSVATIKPTLITGFYYSLIEGRLNEGVPYIQSSAVMELLNRVACTKKYYDPRLLSSLLLYRQQLKNQERVQSALAECDVQIAKFKQEIVEKNEQIASLKKNLAEEQNNYRRIMKSKIIKNTFRAANGRVQVLKNLSRTFFRVLSSQGSRMALIETMNWILNRKAKKTISANDLEISDQEVCLIERSVQNNIENLTPKKVDIVNINFFDWDGEVLYKGGAERYVFDLACLMRDLGWVPRIIQNANFDFCKNFREIPVVGVKTGSGGDIKLMSKKFREICKDSDLVIASPADLACNLSGLKVIGINHGVYWDHKFKRLENSSVTEYKNVFDALRLAVRVVAVDTNFINWTRTYDYSMASKLIYVPNYFDSAFFKSCCKEFEGKIRILYPRRLYEARGIFIVLKAFNYLFSRYKEVELHLVGQANEEDGRIVLDFMESHRGRVIWEEFDMDDVHTVYQKSHIVLVPTLYAEGTSLSCIEAMASNNALIATNVGGLPNLVIDGFNGLLINPSVNALIGAVESLLNNRMLMKKMAAQGLEMSKTFEKSNWLLRWKRVISEVIQ